MTIFLFLIPTKEILMAYRMTMVLKFDSLDELIMYIFHVYSGNLYELTPVLFRERGQDGNLCPKMPKLSGFSEMQ